MSHSQRFQPQREGPSPHQPGAVPAVTVPERLALSARALGKAGEIWLAALPGLLAEKLAAPSVEAGEYDLVIEPSNLWLTIHESIGHATELDRALGYEAAYAGTSFATLDKLDTLTYGSQVIRYDFYKSTVSPYLPPLNVIGVGSSC